MGAPRPFLFRVSTAGLVEFNGIATSGSRTAPIPTSGTNTLSPAVIALEGASIVYSNDVSFVGSDRFSVTLSDANGGDATVFVGVQVTELRLGIGGGPGNSVRVAWPVSATLQGFVLRSADAVADPYTNTVGGTIVTEGSESAL